MAKCLSPRGMNSPQTTMDLGRWTQVFSSPEKASRKLAKIRRRANQILAPYGISVSNDALAQACVPYGRGGKPSFPRNGKAAKRAAAQTLADLLLRKFGVQSVQDRTFTRWDPFVLARGLAAAMAWLRSPEADVRLTAWVADRIATGEFEDL